MANGYDEVKKYADVIAPSNEECGVAQIIEDYIL
jgi:hydroxymethylpyrimidine pyrophosphatase-like HAD family hydrolase